MDFNKFSQYSILKKLDSFYFLQFNKNYFIYNLELNKIHEYSTHNENIYGLSIFLNRIYVIKNEYLTHLIDFDLTEILNIEIDSPIIKGTNTNKNTPLELLLPEDSAFIQYDTKILIIGGKTKNKISNEIISYDCSLYKFEYEKVRENNLIPRFRHGLFRIGCYIYIVGGFTKIDCSEISDTIQLVKYDNLMNTWLTLEVNGAQPMDLLDPKIKIVDERYIIIFSEYKSGIWYLNLKNNTGHELIITGIPKGITYEIDYNSSDKIEIIHISKDNNILNRLVIDNILN